MRFAAVLPGGTATQQLEQALLAEEAGWDGVFVWETGYGVDPWGLLAAVAARTSRIRLGTMVTPLPWRRPWKLASQVATLDQLSGGRAILGVGLGALDEGMPTMGEVTDLRGRAERMDEGIDLIRELWAGGRSFQGRHYVYQEGTVDLARAARPVQDPVPIWVIGAWPRPRSMRRVLRCDGIIPQYQLDSRSAGPDDARAVRAWLTEHGAGPGFDMVAEGETPASDPAAAAATVRPWAEAGCTWWLETRWEMPHDSAERMAQVRERLTAGPPPASEGS
ncbi:LLM class flavin-dependent oxidoreductase [Fodinicola acaciae]|uniref:LLM class flavin-dependent oxidoreductase n=1 Tax=Fodinicola acaciae TaxID=2681555 RepID=UPI0013D0AA13|nr:LLM class flavin-dependent oxidoreductase [Fodinicola acaciae]